MNKSFTLIEILVVIVVIGVLSAFIFVGMSSISSKANIAKGQAFVNSLDNSLLLARVSYWKLDEVNTGITPDAWRTNTGTVTGAILQDSGCISGKCLSFDGSSNYVDFDNKSDFSMGYGDQTVSLWTKYDNELSNDDTLIDCGAMAGLSGYWIYRRHSGNNLRLWFNDGSGAITPYIYSGNLVTNTWYNIVVVFDRDVSAKAYINGVGQTGVDITSKQANMVNGQSYKIGGNLTSYPFVGRIDDFRMYNTVIPVSQIQQEYFLGLNNLFKNNGITLNEFNQRLVELRNNVGSID
jgi:prepilin-type N-terminal cleavage/methylation domain-containing protein